MWAVRGVKLIRTYRLQQLVDEIMECEIALTEAETPTSGLVEYLEGLRTAARILGVLDRPARHRATEA